MRISTVDIAPEELAALKSALGLDVMQEQLNTIAGRQVIIMANFDNLNAKIDEYNNEVQNAITRIDQDFQELRDQLANDAEDQAAVDAAVSKVQSGIDAVKAIDPVPPVNDPDVPGDGENPGEGA